MYSLTLVGQYIIKNVVLFSALLIYLPVDQHPKGIKPAYISSISFLHSLLINTFPFFRVTAYELRSLHSMTLRIYRIKKSFYSIMSHIFEIESQHFY